MRWISYFILAYLIIAVQMALTGYLRWGQASPNLVLPAAVFVAINARREQALLGAFGLGLLQDLFTQHPLGLYAFSYGMVGLFVVGTQPAVYRDHPLTHFFITLLASVLVALVVCFNNWAYPILHSGSAQSRQPILGIFASALYTAALAPIVMGLLGRIKTLFGFRGRHSPINSRQSMSSTRD
ncbi:MAG TPA: rod shape-determining protein MreD [Tepidisphaeraceae bacterium]|jgi:rod shape-determining protein MreD|nr:rod shape-determining protein MreD [Tepidisphaeraceae bacterium]